MFSGLCQELEGNKVVTAKRLVVLLFFRTSIRRLVNVHPVRGIVWLYFLQRF